MKELDIVIENPTGLHARPAKVFVNAAKQFKSNIRVHHGAKKANAKSLISMLTLGVEQGSAIHITIDGEDEDEAFGELQAIIAGGLGEGEQVAAEKAKKEAAAKPRVEPPVALAAPATAPSTDGLIRGIAAAPGIAIAPIFQLQRTELEVEETFTSESGEKDRLQRAVEKARAQLVKLGQQMDERGAKAEADIFDVHREILDDPELLDGVLVHIGQQKSAAEAWQAVIEARAALISQLDDPLLAARAADMHDVGYRVLRLLVGANEEVQALPEHQVVIVANDLSPSDTASLDTSKVVGFCTAAGGPTAHSAIIARALSLPAVVSAGEQVMTLANGTTVILDGSAGTLQVDPDQETIVAAKKQLARWQERQAAAGRAAADPAITRDGHRVEIAANVAGVSDAEQAVKSGAEAVGLLRTEFLFLNRETPPTEDEQYEVYRDIVVAMQGRPVILRTLDIGGDKPLPYIEVPPEQNPFLGDRGIRLCLARPELLRTQLRAILRAAAHGRLLIMFPMVSDLTEIQAARSMMDEIQAELKGPDVPVGIMIEIPAAAMMADALTPYIDFFSVGTNDLTQYTLAIDRMHPRLASQSDGLHPAVLRLIRKTVEAAHAGGKWVGICGELGSDPLAVPILIGLGVDELSVSVPAIALVKAQVRTLTLATAQGLAEKALACATASDVREVARQFQAGQESPEN